MSIKKNIPRDIRDQYEIYEFKHAATILSKEFPGEFKEICDALRQFCFSVSDVTNQGGNESAIPKKMSEILRPLGWVERQLMAELSVYELSGKERSFKHSVEHGTHKVDYVKNRVAFDLEWNSKDQTFDRDLYAFRAFFEYDTISVGIILTRSTNLNEVFKDLQCLHKYGASTTHIDKLIPRLNAGRNGGCPILVFGITQNQITDYGREE